MSCQCIVLQMTPIPIEDLATKEAKDGCADGSGVEDDERDREEHSIFSKKDTRAGEPGPRPRYRLDHVQTI